MEKQLVEMRKCHLNISVILECVNVCVVNWLEEERRWEEEEEERRQAEEEEEREEEERRWAEEEEEVVGSIFDYSLSSEGEDVLPSEEEGQLPQSDEYVPEKGALDEFEMEK